MPHEEYEPGFKQLVHSWKAPLASHLSLRRQQLYRLPTIQSMSLTYKICLWPGAHTQTDMRLHKRHTEHEAFLLPVWEIRPPALCFLFVSVLWDIFLCPSFMSSSAALKSTRDKDRRMKNQRLEGAWSEIFKCEKITSVRKNEHEGGHKWGKMAGGRGQSNCLSRFVSRPA